ncbi:MAG: transporter [Verrucomicrobiaceae bacterium]|nr:transporter [Verrucomicrobiaceae bacterium]
MFNVKRTTIRSAATLAALLTCGSLRAELPATTPPTVGGVEAVGYTTIDANTGAYNQPGWVQRRPFPTTRVHIQRNPGEITVEQWMRWRNKDGENKFRFSEEIEFGLPGRIQLDFYYDWTVEDSKADHLDVAGEIRWAPADWGELPLNPAFYLEYKLTDDDRGGDVIEPKILIGDDFGDGWHWGMNFVYERELSGEKAEEIAITNAISKTITESLSLGMEMAWKRETVDGSRNDPEQKFIIGPQLQWRPTKSMHIDIAGLFGCTEDSPDFEGWLIVGFDFGAPSQKSSNKPVSSRL